MIMKKKLIIAIDGPSGAGKSTLSRLLAKKLGYTNLNTGAMYRVVALAISRSGVPIEDSKAIEALCHEIHIHFKHDEKGETVWLGDENVTELIRSPEMSSLTSKISADEVVRRAMLDIQRELAAAGNVVLEGRDIGSVVFPEAQVKFYLSASAHSRGTRRFKEMRGQGLDVSLEQIIAAVDERDAADSGREHAPLTQAVDAVAIDSTDMTIAQVLERMLDVVRTKTGCVI